MKIVSAIFVFSQYLLFLGISGSSCNTPEERATPQEQHAPAAPLATESDTVRITAMKFVPAEIIVAPGTMVVFINDDMVAHDITEEANKLWSSHLLPPSKSWHMIADKSAHYYCSIHVVMKGSIVVSH